MVMHPKALSLTLDQNSDTAHTSTSSVHAHKPLQIINALTAREWGKQKETPMATYKTVMRPVLRYSSSICVKITCNLNQH